MQNAVTEQSEEEFLKALNKEGKKVPQEHRERLLQIVHLFRESVSWPDAESEFKAGWNDLKAGRVNAVDTLWDGIDAD